MIHLWTESDGLKIDSTDNQLRLNPRLNTDLRNKYLIAVERACNECNLSSHYWLSTSGSSAEKQEQIKLAGLSKEALLTSARAVNTHLQAKTSDVWLNVLPLYHVGGLGIEFRAQLTGSKIIHSMWNASTFFDLCEFNNVSLTSLVPTQVYDLVQLNVKSPKTLRAVIVGGGSLSFELYSKALKLGYKILPSFGMTECCSQIATAELESINPNHYPKLKTLEHVKLDVDNESKLKIVSPSLLTIFASYDDLNKPVFWDPKIKSDSGEVYYQTKDKVKLSEGFIDAVYGRDSDFIKIGGESVNIPKVRQALESVVSEMAPLYVNDLVLIDMPNHRLENELVLVITQKAITEIGINKLAEIGEHYKKTVLPFEKIRRTITVDNIPRSPLGKILFAQLRAQLKYK